MPDSLSTFNRLALALPDIPRWVETRSVLLSGRCEVLGLRETEPFSFAVRSSEVRLVSVVGFPEPEAIREAARRNENQGAVLATPENRDHVAASLADWTASPATIHALGDAPDLPAVPEGRVRLLAPFEITALTGLPADLKEELLSVSERSAIAATTDLGSPVSFCYSASETESLWDISIDTLEGHRRRGHAAMCAAFLIEHMRKRGKEPVWGAEESNPPSMKLAAKLGFVAVDHLIVFQQSSSG
ncbi:MAG: GNAT family N-acetyltransferase [Blastocatellia bacterium]|nr:GNAT family N-acetyltransferase [Blastocatellia bacterium]